MSAGRRKLPPRVPYRDAGEAARQAIARFQAAAARRSVGLREARVFLAVLESTLSYSRVEDRVSHVVLGKLCGLSARTVSRALGALAKADVFEYAPGRGWGLSVVRLPLDMTRQHVGESLPADLSGQHVGESPPSDDSPETLPEVDSVARGVDSMLASSTRQHVGDTTEKDPEKDHREGPEVKPSVLLPAADQKSRSAAEAEIGFEDEGDLTPIGGLVRRAQLAAMGAAEAADEELSRPVTEEEVRRVLRDMPEWREAPNAELVRYVRNLRKLGYFDSDEAGS